MDFDISPLIKEAVVEAVQAGDCGYPGTVGPGDAYAEWAQKTFGWAPRPEHVFAIPDVMTGIAEVLLAKTSAGAGIAINPPVYPPFFFRTEFVGRRVVEAPLARQASGRYELDLAALDAALSKDGVEAYILCSPHNPVGRVWSREDLMSVADICQRRDVLLVVDEIHAPLALGPEHVPFSSLDHEMAARAFTFTSASKGWNVPGLKCAVAVVGADESAQLLNSRWEALIPSHLGVLGTIAAFSQAGNWLDTARKQLAANGRLVGELLSGLLPTVGYVAPEASFLAWLDCRSLGLGDDPAARFLEDGRVALASGPRFGEAGNGYARLNIGTSPELLTDAVQRMRSSIA